MYNKKVTIGRKICKSSIIATELRIKKKEAVKARKQLSKFKKRTKLQKKMLERQKRMDLYIKMTEKPSITYEDGITLYEDIAEVLSLLGYDNVHLSGGLRRKEPAVMAVVAVICSDNYIKKGVNPDLFVQKMAEIGYLSCSIATKDKYRGACNIFMVEGISIVLHMANPTNLGAILLYTTGNMRFLRLVAYHTKNKCHLSFRRDGIFLGEECLASETEEDIFHVLDLDYHSPEERTFPSNKFLRKLW